MVVATTLATTFLWVTTTAASRHPATYLPVNRPFTAALKDDHDQLINQPDMECQVIPSTLSPGQVGVNSMAVTELYKVKCNDAWNISVLIDQKTSNAIYAGKHISDQDRIRRTIRHASFALIFMAGSGLWAAESSSTLSSCGPTGLGEGGLGPSGDIVLITRYQHPNFGPSRWSYKTSPSNKHYVALCNI